MAVIQPGAPKCGVLALALTWLAGSLVFLAGGADGAPVRIRDSFEEAAKDAKAPSNWRVDVLGDLVAESTLIAENRSPDGRHHWRVRVPIWEGGRVELRRGVPPIEAGRQYALSVWLRSAGKTGPITLALVVDGKPVLSERYARDRRWRRYDVTGTPAVGGEAEIVIGFAGPGTLWLDHLQFRPGKPPRRPERYQRRVKPTPGNLVYNSGFELGLAGWSPRARLTVVGSGAQQGRRFGRAELDGSAMESKPVRLSAERVYVVSAYLRSRIAGKRVRIGLAELADGERLEQLVTLTTEWRRHSLKASPTARRSGRYVFFVAADDAVTVDVDAVQIEWGELREHQPRAPYEIALELSRDDLYPQPDQSLTLWARVSGRAPPPSDLRVEWRLTDFHGSTMGAGRTSVVTREGELGAEIAFRVSGRGTQRLRVSLLQGSHSVSIASAVLSMLPAVDLTSAAGRFWRWGAPAQASAGQRVNLEVDDLNGPLSTVGADALPTKARVFYQGVLSPPYQSWGANDHRARVAARRLVKTAVRYQAAGAESFCYAATASSGELTFTGDLPAGPGLLDLTGAGKPVLAAYATAAEMLEGFAPSGRLNTPALEAYVFAGEGETRVVLWSPSGLKAPERFSVALPRDSVRWINLVGNVRGIPPGDKEGGIVLRLSTEPSYLRLAGVSPEAVHRALVAASKQ